MGRNKVGCAINYCKAGMLRGLLEENRYACVRLVLLIGRVRLYGVRGRWGVTDLKARGTTVLVLPALLFNAVQRMSVD